MPDNTRDIPDSANTSGAADVLGKLFQQNQDMEQYAQKKDIDTNASVKLKTQENEFTTALTGLQHKYNVALADHRATIAKDKLLAQGTAVGSFIQKQATGLSQQTGRGIPGITSQMPDPSGYNTEQEGWKSEFIDPRAADTAAKTFESVFSSELRKTEAKDKASYEDVRILLRDKLDLISGDEAAAARELHGALSTMDPTNMSIPLLQGFMTPGQAHKRDYYKVIPQISAQVEKSKAQLKLGKAMEDARLARQVQLHEMDNTNKRAIAELTKGGAAASKAMDTLRKNQSGIMTIFTTYKAEAAELNKIFATQSLNSADEATNRHRYAQVNEEIEKIRPRLEELNNAMIQYTTTVTPNKISPVEAQATRQQFLLKALKGRDPAKLSQKEKDEINQEYNASGGK